MSDFKTVRIPNALVERIDAQRGDVPRDRAVRRALESVFGVPQTQTAKAGGQPDAAPRGRSSAAGPSRAGSTPAAPATSLPKIAPRRSV